jgi:hypothetical protein
MKKSVMILSALCLITSFGGAAVAKEVRGSQAQAIQLLKSKGAVFGPMSPALKAAGAGGTAEGGAGCHGAGACLDLLDAIGEQCKSFRCNSDNGQPSCWCDL